MTRAESGLSPGEMTTASPETLGLLMLKTDIHARHLDDSAQLTAVSDALADGAATAEDFRKRFPGSAPREIARQLQVPIVATDDDPLAAGEDRHAPQCLDATR